MTRTGIAGLAVAVVGLALGVAATPAGAGGAAPLTVEKVVVGTPPPGTEFVVEFQCAGGNNTLDQVVFDEAGNPIGPNTTFFTDPDTCQVVETETGGAATVSYECEGSIPPPPPVPGAASGDPVPAGAITDPCSTPGPQTDPIVVVVVAEGQEATVTVTNTFVEPPPPPPPPTPPEPQPLPVEPTFTG